ncbi:MAG: hypothetical protein KA715_07150 [Xanthomonadaceae bacterium]|nr:hypothetical protein [Xanthomonadaceae bacterium]
MKEIIIGLFAMGSISANADFSQKVASSITQIMSSNDLNYLLISRSPTVL